MYKTKSGRELHFYGESDKKIIAINKIYADINTLDDLFKVLLKCWEKETAYPSCQADDSQSKNKWRRYALL